MKLIKDLGMKYPKETSKQKKRIGLYECSYCKKHFEAITADVLKRKQTRCKQCSKIKYTSKDEIITAKKEAVNKFRKTKKGLITKIYSQQKSSAEKRNMTLPTYTNKELQEWATSQVNFDILYTNWVSSKFDNKLIPSIDRIDDSKSYTLDNIQLTTWIENKNKHEQQVANGEKEHKGNPHRAVIKCDMDGNEICEYFSLKYAERKTGICASNIHNVCNGKYGFKTAGGFKWKFKA